MVGGAAQKVCQPDMEQIAEGKWAYTVKGERKRTKARSQYIDEQRYDFWQNVIPEYQEKNTRHKQKVISVRVLLLRWICPQPRYRLLTR